MPAMIPDPGRGTRQPRPCSGRSQPMPLPIQPRRAGARIRVRRRSPGAALPGPEQLHRGLPRRLPPRHPLLLSRLAARGRARSMLTLAGKPAAASRATPTFALDFQLDDEDDSRRLRPGLALRGLAPADGLPAPGPGPARSRAHPRDRQGHGTAPPGALSRVPRVSLLQLRRGMPEDHYVAASVEPSAYSAAVRLAQPDRRGHPDPPDHGAVHLRESPGDHGRPDPRSRPEPRPGARPGPIAAPATRPSISPSS